MVGEGLLIKNCCCGLVAGSRPTLCNPMNSKPARLLCPWDFPAKNPGVGCHFLLQEIFLTKDLNPCLLHWQTDSLPLSHQGSPKSFQWFHILGMAMPAPIIYQTLHKEAAEGGLHFISVFSSRTSAPLRSLGRTFWEIFKTP